MVEALELTAPTHHQPRRGAHRPHPKAGSAPPSHDLLARYRDLPASTLAAQLFLAAGWLRATTAHALSHSWWTGEEVSSFVEGHADTSVWVYRAFLADVVGSLPAVTAAVVCLLQLAVGVALALNVRPAVALATGAFLNLHFLLSGAVNPSAFYLVLALIIGLSLMERTVLPASGPVLVRRVAIGAAGLAIAVAPSLGDLAPSKVIEDPAAMVLFLAALAVGATWWTSQRIGVGAEPISE